MKEWREYIVDAFRDSDLSATQKQIDNVTSWIESAYEDFNIITGYEVTDKSYMPLEDMDKEIEVLKARLQKHRLYVASTKMCTVCHSTRSVVYSGKKVACSVCSGVGRVLNG